MAQQVRKPQWNIYEAVVLLDGYLEILDGNKTKSSIIRKVSEELRQMAINNCQTIDEVYRNENGISYRIQSMDSAYKGHKMYVPATKLFLETVDIYHNDRDRYNLLLKKARSMIKKTNNIKDQFMTWLSFKVTKAQYIEALSCYPEIENYCMRIKVLKKPLLETEDIKKVKKVQQEVCGNKFFHQTHKKQIKKYVKAIQLYYTFMKEHCNVLNSYDVTLRPQIKSEYVDTDKIVNIDAKNNKNAKSEQNQEIVTILKKYYPYGFRIDSIREMMRFRYFAEEKDITLPEADDELKAMILTSGSLIEGKVFCNIDDVESTLKEIVNRIFEAGINVIYYESLYEVETEWMSKHFITSEEMLKEVLQRYTIGYFFSKKFMLRVEKKPEREAVTEEIIRVWGDHQTVAVDEMDKRLPYIPLSNILRVISGNSLFVLSAEGEYLYTKKLLITDKEITDIRKYVELACEENGFASLSDLPLGNVIEENYGLSLNAIQNAIYKIALSDKYYINGKIITKENGTLDAIALLKKDLYGKESCTFSELSNKAVELTGVVNRQYVFQALYDCMVRIDEDHFVDNKMVAFDVEEIDRVLKNIITDRFCAIKEITTFALFPVCGQVWTHYLLESYCYKYSKEYSLHILNFNDKNAGIIAEKDFDKSYFDMLAIALARKDVELTSDSAGTYLCSTGYMAKSKYAKLNEIVAEAQALRKER